jgi:predicted transglutaminase-like protease
MKLNIFLSIKNYIKEMWLNHYLNLPTQEDILDSEVLKLTEKLKGESEKETLTNILEWQDRNIGFWFERWTIPFIFLPTFFGFMVIIGLKFGYVSPVKVGTIPLVITGTALALVLVYLLILKFINYRDMDWNTINYTLSLNPPVNKILEYRLALCRDYTRLTASLLFNLYSELYFIRTTWHETVGVKIKDEIYVLDQHLPILTLDNDKYANAEIYSAKRDSNGIITLKQEQKMPKTLSKKVTEQLTEEVAKILNIKQYSPKGEPDIKIPLENFVKYHYDALIKFSYDEIIKYSLIRAIKNRLENEFYVNTDKISKIMIKQDKEDLILEVYYIPL